MFGKAKKVERFYVYEPEPDITTYELALILKLYGTSRENDWHFENTFNKMPLGVQRHFRVLAGDEAQAMADKLAA